MNVRTAVTNLLRAVGITTIFGNPGSTELGLLRARYGGFIKEAGIKVD